MMMMRKDVSLLQQPTHWYPEITSNSLENYLENGKKCAIKPVRKEIQGDHDDDQMLVHNHNQLHKMTVQDIRFGAQVYVKPNETTENHRKFVIDFLLLQVPPNKIYQEERSRKPLACINKFIGKQSLGALPFNEQPAEYHVTRFVNITCAEDIDRLRENGIAVFIDGHIGSIEASPEALPNGEGFAFGWHISFRTESA